MSPEPPPTAFVEEKETMTRTRSFVSRRLLPKSSTGIILYQSLFVSSNAYILNLMHIFTHGLYFSGSFWAWKTAPIWTRKTGTKGKILKLQSYIYLLEYAFLSVHVLVTFWRLAGTRVKIHPGRDISGRKKAIRASLVSKWPEKIPKNIWICFLEKTWKTIPKLNVKQNMSWFIGDFSVKFLDFQLEVGPQRGPSLVVYYMYLFLHSLNLCITR